MEVEDELIQIANVTTPRIIKVIGVGGGGGNAVGQMYRDNIPEVRYLVANTDQNGVCNGWYGRWHRYGGFARDSACGSRKGHIDGGHCDDTVFV